MTWVGILIAALGATAVLCLIVTGIEWFDRCNTRRIKAAVVDVDAQLQRRRNSPIEVLVRAYDTLADETDRQWFRFTVQLAGLHEQFEARRPAAYDTLVTRPEIEAHRVKAIDPAKLRPSEPVEVTTFSDPEPVYITAGAIICGDKIMAGSATLTSDNLPALPEPRWEKIRG